MEDNDESRRNKQKTKNGPPTPDKTQPALRSSDLSAFAKNLAQSSAPSSPTQLDANRGNTPPAQPKPISSTRELPATASQPKDVSTEKLGTLRVPTKAQMQAQLNMGSYTPEKQQKIDTQWQQTQTKAMDYVHGRVTERSAKRNSTAQEKQQSSAPAQGQTGNREQSATTSGQQQARGKSILDRPSQTPEQSKADKQVAQTQTKAQTQAQPTQEKTKQQAKEASKNVFDQYNQQREKSKVQQQEKEKTRGR